MRKRWGTVLFAAVVLGTDGPFFLKSWAGNDLIDGSKHQEKLLFDPNCPEPGRGKCLFPWATPSDKAEVETRTNNDQTSIEVEGGLYKDIRRYIPNPPER